MAREGLSARPASGELAMGVAENKGACLRPAICTLRFGECAGEGPDPPGAPCFMGRGGVAPLPHRVGGGGVPGWGGKLCCCSKSTRHRRCCGLGTTSCSILPWARHFVLVVPPPWETDPAQPRQTPGWGVAPSPCPPPLPGAASAQGSRLCRNWAGCVVQRSWRREPCTLPGISLRACSFPAAMAARWGPFPSQNTLRQWQRLTCLSW